MNCFRIFHHSYSSNGKRLAKVCTKVYFTKKGHKVASPARRSLWYAEHVVAPHEDWIAVDYA